MLIFNTIEFLKSLFGATHHSTRRGGFRGRYFSCYKNTAILNGYYFRHVDKGYETFYEWDDDVVYYKGNVKDTVNLFYKTDYMPKFYYINFTSKNGGCDSSRIYVKDKLTGEEYFLVFKNYVEARDFSKWLLNFPVGKPFPIVDIGIAKPSPVSDSLALSDSIRINPGFTLMKRSFGCQHSEVLTKRTIVGMNLSIMGLSHLKKLEKY